MLEIGTIRECVRLLLQFRRDAAKTERTTGINLVYPAILQAEAKRLSVNGNVSL